MLRASARHSAAIRALRVLELLILETARRRSARPWGLASSALVRSGRLSSVERHELNTADNSGRMISTENHGSSRDSRDLPSLWLESAPCPSVSGLVRGGGSCGPPPLRRR